MFIEDTCYQHRAFRDQTNQPHRHPHHPKQAITKLMHDLDQQNNSEDEGIQDYKIGGYHPVHIGEVLINRYVVIQKLGWGHFSTVWLCKDFKFSTYVAVKIQKSSPHYMEAAFDEVEILQKVEQTIQSDKWSGKSRDESHVVEMLNAFIHRTVYGNHFCMVFEILRCNLLDVIKMYNYEGVPLPICQEISKQVLKGLDFLHRACGVIHTDLKPQNVMLCLQKEELRDIIENGQMVNSEIFEQRVQFFRDVLKINVGNASDSVNLVKADKSDQIIEKVSQISEKLKQEKLSKNQKKNLKKKLKKLKMNCENEEENNKVLRKEDKEKKFDLAQILNINKGKFRFNNGGVLKLPIQVKIGDLGNACWKHHHFSTEIQTRQYRSPEVILAQSYNETADIWSFACMIYEMLTGDLLFQPRKTEEWGKNDDHLAQIQELLGPFDLNFIARSPKKSKYFTKQGKMKRMPPLNHYSLSTVMQIKNRIKFAEAQRFAKFLVPMLVAQPERRAKAHEALQDSWLEIDNFEQQYKMKEQEHQALKEQFYQNQHKFRSEIPKKTEEDASAQDNGVEAPHEKTKNKKRQVFADIRYIDRSFTDLGYIGYCHGIDFHKLDACANWQFS